MAVAIGTRQEYRATATIDMQDDRTSRTAGKRIRTRAPCHCSVRGRGHFIRLRPNFTVGACATTVLKLDRQTRDASDG